MNENQSGEITAQPSVGQPNLPNTQPLIYDDELEVESGSSLLKPWGHLISNIELFDSVDLIKVKPTKLGFNEISKLMVTYKP